MVSCVITHSLQVNPSIIGKWTDFTVTHHIELWNNWADTNSSSIQAFCISTFPLSDTWLFLSELRATMRWTCNRRALALKVPKKPPHHKMLFRPTEGELAVTGHLSAYQDWWWNIEKYLSVLSWVTMLWLQSFSFFIFSTIDKPSLESCQCHLCPRLYKVSSTKLKLKLHVISLQNMQHLFCLFLLQP